MQVGMIGLGRMGANMARRLVAHGHDVIGFDPAEATRDALGKEGLTTVDSLAGLRDALTTPRVAWVMVPSKFTSQTVTGLMDVLEPGDLIVNGCNSPYQESRADAARVGERGIGYVDAGVSGGVWGLKNGYCLMVGGDADQVAKAEPLFQALAPEGGYGHVGAIGAGHFTKMVHNGIEYGMMQAYAEGFAIMAAAAELEIDNHQMAGIWRYGSVIQSWLLELLERALDNPEEFASITGYVEDSGEGRWTINEAVSRGVPAPVITASLFERFSSRDPNLYANRITAALRNQFGGHAVKERERVAQGEAPSPAGPDQKAPATHKDPGQAQ